jgi:hypothetical protein
MEPPMKAKTTPEERLRLDALRYRALRHSTVWGKALDNEADRLVAELHAEGIILDPEPTFTLLEAPTPITTDFAPKKKRTWSKQRREKHARMMEKRKAKPSKERVDEVSESRVQPRS